MSFTDDDLKRLKERLNYPERSITFEAFYEEIEALLARLERAENFIFDPKELDECGWCVAEENDDNTLTHQSDCELNNAYKAWRKSKEG